MKKLVNLIIIIALAAVIVGCESNTDDRRLAVADSLMWIKPDSSLSIVDAIDPRSLDDGNKAYHALLLTQAQFRCYVEQETDSIISTAVDYYSSHGDRERYTRSLLYKGAFYEFSAGDPVEAMKLYKIAEGTADTADYRNLAQLNMRMGMIYYYNFVENNLDLNKFELAHHYYALLGDTTMQMIALSYVGKLYRTFNNKKALEILKECKKLALAVKDSSNYFDNCYYLAKGLLIDSNYVEAKNQCMLCLNNNRILDDGLYYALANCYIGLHNNDSALYYINKGSQEKENPQVYVERMQALYNYSIAVNDAKAASRYNKELMDNCDSVEINETTHQLAQVEKIIVEKELKHKQERMHSQQRLIIMVFLGGIVALIVVAFLVYRRRKKLIQERNDLKEQLESYATDNNREVMDFIQQVDLTHNSPVVQAMQYHIDLVNKIMTLSQNESMTSHFKEIGKITRDYRSNTKIIGEFETFINTYYDNFIYKLREDYPNLSEKDITIIILLFLGFDDANISVITGMSIASLPTTYTRMARKLRLNTSLRKYLGGVRKKEG